MGNQIKGKQNWAGFLSGKTTRSWFFFSSCVQRRVEPRRKKGKSGEVLVFGSGWSNKIKVELCILKLKKVCIDQVSASIMTREYNEKKASGGFVFSRIRSNLASRNLNHEDGSIKCCNRLGCSTRYYSPNGIQTSSSQLAKNPKASFLAVSSKTRNGRSTISPTVSSYSKKSQEEQRGQTLTQDANNADRFRQGESEDSESSNSQEELVLPDAEDVGSSVGHRFTENVTATLISSGTKSKSKTRKEINKQWESGNQNSPSSSSIRLTIASRNVSHTNKHATEVSGSGVRRPVSRDADCVSVSDVFPSGSPSFDSGHNKRVDMARKRPSEGQSSSTGKNMTSLNGGHSGSRFRGYSTPSLSPPERLISQQTLRKVRNRPTYRDGAELVRKRQAPTGGTRLRMSEQEDDRSLPLAMSDVTSKLPQVEFSFSGAVPEYLTRSRQVGSRSWTSHNQRTDVEGIPEMLLTLERFEQNEELTYEQLLVLEANISLGGLTFHDRHRAMRLDIDNMSYEELLALEEKIGTVSTALSDEALSRCLKRSIMSLVPGINDLGDDDTKCSICQEEYVTGDEVGELECDHRYHVACIHQWLGQKNWCPICKACACSS